MLAQGHIISVSVGAIAAVVSVYVPRKHSVSCGHTAHVKFLCFSSKIQFFFSLARFSSVDAFSHTIRL
jgi:hypothetical protein